MCLVQAVGAARLGAGQGPQGSASSSPSGVLPSRGKHPGMRAELQQLSGMQGSGNRSQIPWEQGLPGQDLAGCLLPYGQLILGWVFVLHAFDCINNLL